MSNKTAVVVLNLPPELRQAEVKRLLDDLRPLWETDRPRVVLDCSNVEHIDSAGVELLLHCLQEAMKRDGDLKLAAVSPASAIILELMRVDRLFEVFETSEAAVRSFHEFGATMTPQNQPWYTAALRASDLKAAS
jgi:anti-sigma B factor antagonist